MILELSSVKTYLSENTTDNDGIISELIDEAETIIENYIGSPLSETTFTEIRDGYGEQTFTLRKAPVSELTSFQYNTGTIPVPVWENFDTELYRLESGRGQIVVAYQIPK